MIAPKVKFKLLGLVLSTHNPRACALGRVHIAMGCENNVQAGNLVGLTDYQCYGVMRGWDAAAGSLPCFDNLLEVASTWQKVEVEDGEWLGRQCYAEAKLAGVVRA